MSAFSGSTFMEGVMSRKLILTALVSLLLRSALSAQSVGVRGPEIDLLAKQVELKVIAWR